MGHCNGDFIAQMTRTEFPKGTYFAAKSGSNLALLNTKIKNAILYHYAKQENPDLENSPPPELRETYTFFEGAVRTDYILPNIAAGDKMAVMGDFGIPTVQKKWCHFHIELYMIETNTIGQPPVTQYYKKRNIANMHALNNYVRSLLSTPPTYDLHAGNIIFRRNIADRVVSGKPTGLGTCLDQYYIELPTLTPTPSLGFPTPSNKVIIFQDVDFMQNAYTKNGWNSVMFENIDFKINRILPTYVTAAGLLTHKASATNIVHATPFALPTSVPIINNSFGVTFPPPKAPEIQRYVIPSSTPQFVFNWDYGVVFEYANASGRESLEIPHSWTQNPYTKEGDASFEDFCSFFILSNLHTKYSPNGEFRFDARNRYLCWNSNVHKEYKTGGNVQWWLPPQWGTTTSNSPTTSYYRKYPPIHNSHLAPSHAPALTENLAYNPEFAHFPDGRYNIDTEYDPVRGSNLQHSSADFYVDNFKPFLRYISVHQQQIDWDRDDGNLWKDPDVDDDWISRTNLPSKDIQLWSSSGSIPKTLYEKYCVYNAFWEYKEDQTDSHILGSVVGEDGILDLKTSDLSLSNNPEIVADYCNFETRGSSARAKRWVNGRKPLYFELEFSEPIDKDTFTLDLEDRWGDFRSMITSANYVACPAGITDDSSLFDYFTFSNLTETKFTFKYGSNNKTIIAKLPALGRFMQKNAQGQWISAAIFDAAERRISINCKDEAGNGLACLEDITQSCKEKLCRGANGHFLDEYGDSWLHRLSIDTVTECRCEILPAGLHNWLAVDAEIQSLESNGDFNNIVNWHWLHVQSNNAFNASAWTVQYDPKRNISRRSIDGDWIPDSAGTRETRVQVGAAKVDDRVNSLFARIMAGNPLGFGVSPNSSVEIACYTVDACGNKDYAVGFVQCNFPPPSLPPTSIPCSWLTTPPNTNTTAPPFTSDWRTEAPTGEAPERTSIVEISTEPPPRGDAIPPEEQSKSPPKRLPKKTSEQKDIPDS